MQRVWRERNPDYHKQHAIRYAERKRTLARSRKYAEPASRPEPQNCECCALGFDNSVPARRACYDHDHTTGKFRGWLCNGCNITLARAGDSTEGVQRFVSYLARAELLL
jgi:Recombination endonuclease VII